MWEANLKRRLNCYGGKNFVIIESILNCVLTAIISKSETTLVYS